MVRVLLCGLLLTSLAACPEAEIRLPDPATCASDAECDDGNPCTVDGCAADGCVSLAMPLGCEDGDPCTVGDLCSEGACRPGLMICECQADADCDDGDACNGAEACDAAGACQSGPPLDLTCTASGPCAVSACDPATGACLEASAADGAPCDDGDACTEGDQCAEGACAAGPDTCECQADADCDDDDACNGVESCDLATHTCDGGTAPAACVASGPCKVTACDPTTGACVEEDAADGLPCDDADACTTADACLAGSCAGGPPPGCDGLACGDGTQGCSCGECGDTGVCLTDGQCLSSGDACGDLPPDGACVLGAGAACVGGALQVTPCAEACGSCEACVGECVAGESGCSVLGTHAWTCADADGCGLRAWTLCELGCVAGLGCLETVDTDGDEVPDVLDDDDDGDGALDDVDLCPLIVDDQTDTDADGAGDACDDDDDDDYIPDAVDLCPLVADAAQLDTDGDGAGDACDDDDDGDGVPDAGDACPLIADAGGADTDSDGAGDACDVDDDGDGVIDGADNCPLDANLDQLDVDADGLGDACDSCDATTEICPVGPSIVTPGTVGAYRLLGLVITPAGPIEGEVLVVGETIACVGSCSDHVDAAGAWVIETDGVIMPGLIDSHNHILFDIFDADDWVPSLPDTCVTEADCIAGTPYCDAGDCRCVDNVCRYMNHTQWPKEDQYTLMLDYKQCLADASQGKPDWCPAELDEDGDVKCEMHKWGELKGLIAGTTSIVGLPGTSGPCVASLARSIDVSQNDIPGDKIQTSALFPPSKSSGDGVCANFLDGDTEAYIVHVGEGVDAKALAEFDTLYTLTTTDGCLFDPRTTITHGTAFGTPEFEAMAAAGMKLVWSPASNLALYGETADIPAALAAGVQVALGPDWSMGGSQNMLDELRVADAWDNAHWGDVLSPQDLFEMATVNGAAVLGLDGVLGTLEEGLLADLVVLPRGTGTPYEALLAARPGDLSLVMVGGVPLVGDPAIQAAAPQDPGCETLDFCGVDRFVCAAEASTADKLDQTVVAIHDALQGALTLADALVPADPTLCGGCAADEECFPYGAKPIVDASLCPAACPSGEVCVQVSKSGATPYACLPDHSCSPAKSQKAFDPVAPLLRCEAAATGA